MSNYPVQPYAELQHGYSSGRLQPEDAIYNEPISNPAAESLRLTTNAGGPTKLVQDIVENWHNDEHPGAFRVCSEQPCHAVNSVRR